MWTVQEAGLVRCLLLSCLSLSLPQMDWRGGRKATGRERPSQYTPRPLPQSDGAGCRANNGLPSDGRGKPRPAPVRRLARTEAT